MILPSPPKLGSFLEPHLRQADPSLLSMFSLLRGQRWGSCGRGLPPCHAGPGAGTGGRNGHEEPVLIFLPGELGCGSQGRWPFFCPPGRVQEILPAAGGGVPRTLVPEAQQPECVTWMLGIKNDSPASLGFWEGLKPQAATSSWPSHIPTVIHLGNSEFPP